MSSARRHSLFRPLGDRFRDDLIGVLAVLAGCVLGALLLGGSFAVLLGALVGATLVVVGKAVRRRVKRRGARSEPGI